MISIGIVGTGRSARSFARLFGAHPDVERVLVTEPLVRSDSSAADEWGGSTVADFDAMLATDVDAIAVFTPPWTHGPLVVKALKAGKHVYSAAPMAGSVEEIGLIIKTVRDTGLTYMMGETSFYDPATVFARSKAAEGAFGRVFYAEGDYVQDLDLVLSAADDDDDSADGEGGSEDRRSTASYPPMLYPTHAVGGVLGAIQGHAMSVSCLGVRDDRDDGVFDRALSRFDNDFSNATALFELDTGCIVRTNEMRRVGYPPKVRPSRYRFFGTDASFEQLATVSLWQDKHHVVDVSDRLDVPAEAADAASAMATGDRGTPARYASVQDPSRLPDQFRGLPNGHQGSHHFLADDFVRAVTDGVLPPVNAWVAARYTLPGIIAHQSALQGGLRLWIPDYGDAPQ